MNKDSILREIRRTAEANGGRPLGWRRFLTETGIRETDWLGTHWARWSDAVREAGFVPNRLQQPYEKDVFLAKLAELALELGRLPNRGDLRFRAARDSGFPNPKTFSRLGGGNVSSWRSSRSSVRRSRGTVPSPNFASLFVALLRRARQTIDGHTLSSALSTC